MELGRQKIIRQRASCALIELRIIPAPPVRILSRRVIIFETRLSMAISIQQLALVLHLVVELPACINFFFRPSATLGRPQPHAHGVVRQYALLLLVTNAIALLLLMSPQDHMTGQISGIFALYHFGPFVRAISRIRNGERQIVLGGPWLHAMLHAMSAATLASAFLFGRFMM